MGGGPTTPDLVVAVAAAGGLGFLAAGYKTVEAMHGEIAAVRDASGGAYGVNLFLPHPKAPRAVVDSYLRTVDQDARRLGTSLAEPVWDDDGYVGKVEALLADPPPIVS